MKNLYDMFSMRPPNRAALARRLMGDLTAAPASGVAVRVSRSAAPNAFFRRVGMPMSNAIAPHTYPLGANGGLAGLRGIGALGAGDPALLLVPGVYFKFTLDKQDFITGRAIHQIGLKKLGLVWVPVDPGFVQKVTVKMNELANAGFDMDSLAAEGNRLTNKVFSVGEGTDIEAVLLGARGEVDIFGTVISNTVEKNRLNAMRELKGWLNYVLTIPTPASGGYIPPGSAGGYVPLNTGKGAGKDVQAPAVKPSGPPIPLILGGIAAAGVLALVIAKRAKKK